MGESERTAFQEAVDQYSAGETVLVLAESPTGTAADLIGAIPEGVAIRGHVDCAQSCRSEIGRVSRDLDLDSFSGGALILEDAQWADATSLGRLQRLLRSSDQPVLIVAAYRPIEGIEGWWIDRLAGAASKHARLLTVALDYEEPADQEPLTGQAADFLAAAALLTGPVSVRVLAELTSTSQEEVLQVGERLVAEGLLAAERGGYVTGPDFNESAVGEVRLGLVASRLAPVMADDGASPAIVGSLYLASANYSDAFEVLYQAAHEATERNADGEAFQLSEDALKAAEEAGLTTDPRLGELHLTCGRFLRTAGRTDWALSHLETATNFLEGQQRIEALRLMAMLADDAQHPQDAERTIAQAELEAVSQGRSDELGSLLTLHARSLNRIGFAAEADVTLAKALEMLDEDTDQRHYALSNRAWIHFDRGEARVAESEFAQRSEQARRENRLPAVADNEGWRSRALFAAGRPTDALESISVVEELSLSEGVEAPLFLADLARTEGGLAYGQYEAALAASEEVLDLVERQLPAWENMARSLRAQAFLRLGRFEDASAEIAKALELTPPGANGWRWRTRCRAIEMEINAALGERFNRDAEDLADLLLQSRLFGWAAELLCVIAEQGLRKDAAGEALAIATQIGQPMLAARCAEAGGLWSDPAAASTIAHIKHLDVEIPDEWREKWIALPHVRAALDAPEIEDAEPDAAAVAMEKALTRAGLSGEVILSPAQRRDRGLVVRSRRRLRPLTVLAAALGVIALAAGTAFGVSQLVDDPQDVLAQPATPTTQPGPTTTLPLEGREIPFQNERGFLFGFAPYRGDFDRTGYQGVSGPTEVNGYYWKTRTAGSINTAPVAFGQQLFVGTSEGTFYIFDQSDGDFYTVRADGDISSAPAIGRVDRGEERNPAVVIFGDDAGVARMISIGASGADPWRTELGGRIQSSPVIHRDSTFVATSEGFVYKLDLFSGEVLDAWPAEGEGVGPIVADLTYSGDYLYVGTQEGILYVLDISGALIKLECEFDARSPIDVNAIVDDGVVYVPTTSRQMWTFPEGDCDGRAPNRLPQYAAEQPIKVAPAIVNGVLYIPENAYLYAKDLANESVDLWMPGHVDTDSRITAPPVVTEDTVYFAAANGIVYAVDSKTGDLRWTWQTDLPVFGPVAVTEDAVFIAGSDGFVYAVGP